MSSLSKRKYLMISKFDELLSNSLPVDIQIWKRIISYTTFKYLELPTKDNLLKIYEEMIERYIPNLLKYTLIKRETSRNDKKEKKNWEKIDVIILLFLIIQYGNLDIEKKMDEIVRIFFNLIKRLLI